MIIVCIVIAQSIYSYGMGIWGSAYKTHPDLLETTVNYLFQILFKEK